MVEHLSHGGVCERLEVQIHVNAHSGEPIIILLRERGGWTTNFTGVWTREIFLSYFLRKPALNKLLQIIKAFSE